MKNLHQISKIQREELAAKKKFVYQIPSNGTYYISFNMTTLTVDNAPNTIRQIITTRIP
jgi:hypothetical protein